MKNTGQISTLAMILFGIISSTAIGIGSWNALTTIKHGERITAEETTTKNIEKRFDRFEEKIDKRFDKFEAIILGSYGERN